MFRGGSGLNLEIEYWRLFFVYLRIAKINRIWIHALKRHLTLQISVTEAQIENMVPQITNIEASGTFWIPEVNLHRKLEFENVIHRGSFKNYRTTHVFKWIWFEFGNPILTDLFFVYLRIAKKSHLNWNGIWLWNSSSQRHRTLQMGQYWENIEADTQFWHSSNEFASQTWTCKGNTRIAQ